MPDPASPSFASAAAYWLRLGFVNFGGPAGQIAMMHRDTVEERGWIEDGLFLRALNFCMLLPGPEALQLAIYIGWRLHGVAGGTVAGLFFILPASILMFGLSYVAAVHGHIPVVAGLFAGISAAVLAVVAEALVKLSRKSLKAPLLYAFAAASFVAGSLLHVPFPLVVFGSGLAALLLAPRFPDIFAVKVTATNCQDTPEAVACRPASWHSFFYPLAVCAGLWLLVAGPVLAAGGIVAELTTFFSKAAFVTFGGAYAVLAYVAEAGAAAGWLDPKDMLLGLGLAETTPGPLILVNQYVGFVSAFKHPGSLDPLNAAFFGGLMTSFATFLPSFALVFAGAPFIEALTGNKHINAALKGVSAAVVGVVLGLSVRFAESVLFPKTAGFDFFSLLVALAAWWALTKAKWPMPAVIAAAAGLGCARALLF